MVNKQASLLLLLPLVLACTRPATEALRQHPAPPLALEIALPEGPDSATLKRAYLGAFQSAFGAGLATGPGATNPDRIQMLVVIGTRAARPKAEADWNRNLDEASAVAAGQPLRLLYGALGPKSAYESAVDALGYRPPYITGQIVLLRTGKNGFQKNLELDPWPIIYRMHPLGEAARAHGGIEAQEAQAVAQTTLDLLHQQCGWTPPPAP